MPFGFGASKQSSSSSSFGSSSGSTFIDQTQQPFLDFLRNTGMDLFGGLQAGGENVAGAAQGLFGQGQSMLGGLQNNPFLGALSSQAGGNPGLVQAQTEALGQNLGQFFNQQLMPGINRQAQGMGQLGGGRQGVAEGMGVQSMLQQMQQGAVGFQTADAERSMQAAQSGGALYNQGSLGGLNAMSGLLGMLQSGQQSSMAPLAMLASIFGDPTVLSRQQSMNSSQSKSSGSSFSMDGL